jgi:two-component system response regulator PilR (NtrC family)
MTASASNRPVALVVDDEPDICELLAMTLDRMQIETDTCNDVSSARRMLEGRDYQLCLTDMRLPDGDGLDLVEWMQGKGMTTPVAVITAHGNVETAVRALKLGAFDFISKPLNLQALRKLVSTALKLPREDQISTEVTLLGESPAIDQLRKMIGKVARSQAPVHITGESGTGKELVARMIHSQGARADGPFIPVNCGAIPSELMESEFFGHRKGAFTGAINDNKGLFQSAEGGTLFMDEIADLPLPMQVKLLRVIQEKSVRPVGVAQEVPVDVRILSATHKNLSALVAAGQFREDLFYRVNVIELTVAPLRERRVDIPILTQRTLQNLAANLDIPVPVLTEEALGKLAGYAFPGNVRELENILERAVALSGDAQITADDIQIQRPTRHQPGVPAEDSPDLRKDLKADGHGGHSSDRLGDQLESVERDAIVNALQETRYNKTAAARRLGLTLRALRYRMQKLGID